MKKAKQAKDAENARVEQERKLKKEIRTGGGFITEKLNQLRAQATTI